jgi:hypothetical protein
LHEAKGSVLAAKDMGVFFVILYKNFTVVEREPQEEPELFAFTEPEPD